MFSPRFVVNKYLQDNEKGMIRLSSTLSLNNIFVTMGFHLEKSRIS